MYHLIYISHAVQPFTEKELIALLDISRKNNKQLGITGMLLYLNEKFIQVLEGKRETVKELINKIEKDPRHKRLSVLLEGNTRARIFHNWSMGFKHLQHHDFTKLSGFTDMDQFFHEHTVTNDSSSLLIFLKLFYDKNMVDHPELV